MSSDRAMSVPPDIEVVRIVDIVGLDTQADAGTHVASTRHIGGLEIVKIENKGKANVPVVAKR